MSPIVWLILFIVFVAIEVSTMALTTIWFAGGAVAGFVLSLLGCSFELQLGAFCVLAFVLLVLTRPFAKKIINRETVKTNIDTIAGKTARVSETIDNIQGTGTAVLDGQEWTARAENDSDIIEKGTIVTVREIRGVKLIVSK